MLCLAASLPASYTHQGLDLRHMYAIKRDFINNVGLNTFMRQQPDNSS